MKPWRRIWRNLCAGPWTVRRTFPPHVLAAVQEAVRRCEARHAGEIRFAVEAALPLEDVARGLTPRERAIQVFAELGVWDTEHNNGVLIYVLLSEHDVEIVADRGVARGRVEPSEWEACCRVMEAHFREGRYEAGAVAGIEAIAEVLARHPPERPDAGNELPDQPTIL